MPMEHVHDLRSKSLLAVIALNLGITAIEFVGAAVSGSLALFSDGLHNLSDVMAILISYAALRWSKRPRSARYTYGYKRAEILAALSNAITLVLICFYLIFTSIGRLFRPEPIAGSIMLTVAVAGLLANLAGAALLRKPSANSLNMRSAYFHLYSDAAASLAVILGALGILLFHITWLDAALTLVISIYLFIQNWSIIAESLEVIMMASPKGIDVQRLMQSLTALPRVVDLHHIHVWRLNDSETYLEAHVRVQDMALSETIDIQAQIKEELARHEIRNVTLQFESTDGLCSCPSGS